VTTKTRLTPRQRLTRGLTYTAVGPLDITLGTVALGLQGAQSAGSGLRRRYSKARVARQVGSAQETLARELTAAQGVVAGLPQALQQARKPNRRRRRLVIFSVAGLLTLAGGAVAFTIIRRSSEPEPSPRPPSVEVTPKP
jgi:Cell wall synthesis protein CwsA